MEKLFDKSYGITSDSPADVSTLEITMKIGCPIQCKYCPQNLLIREYNKISKKIEMSFNTFKTCLDKLPLTTIVCFAGFSEPFYTKEAVTMMKYAAKEREVSLFTTLVGLDEKQIDEVLGIPFRKVVIHLPDKYNFSKIDITPQYIMKLKAFVNAVKSNGAPFVDKMTCQAPPNEEVLGIIKGGFHVSWNMNNRAGNLPYPGKDSYLRGKLKCRLSNFNHNILLSDGTVVLCSMDFGLKHILGKLYYETYEQVINSLERRTLLKKCMSLDNDLLCRRCSEARKWGEEK